MKKISSKKKLALILFNRKIQKKLKRRKKRKKRNKCTRKNKQAKVITVQAPVQFSLEKKLKNKTIEFINQVLIDAESVSRTKRKIKLDFSKTNKISPDACSLLIATFDSIKQQYPQIKYQVLRPKPLKQTILQNNAIFDVHSIFCQVGLYKLLGKNYTNYSKSMTVNTWCYVAGENSDGSLAEPIIKKISKRLQKANNLYKGVIEAMSNSTEHAYRDDIKTTRTFKVKKWWCLVGILNNYISVVICDLGHGIPNTLEFNKPGKIKKWLKTLKEKGGLSCDSDYIKVASDVKKKKNDDLRETSTGMKNRGNGTNDFKVLTQNYKNSYLIIHSNKGSYKYSKKGEEKIETYDNKSSINGTIVSWIIPVTEGKNNVKK